MTDGIEYHCVVHVFSFSKSQLYAHQANGRKCKKYMALPKFIITQSGWLRLGMVNQHRDLLHRFDVCIGGGYYEFDYVGNRILLSRSSYDFGKPRWGRLQTLIVPAAYRGMSIIYRYDDGEEFRVTDNLLIEYND